MAIYEYQCATCGKRIEVMQAMSAAPLQECGEHCVASGAERKRGHGRVERLFSAVNVGRSGGAASSGFAAPDDPSCGRCGRTGPDVCGA